MMEHHHQGQFCLQCSLEQIIPFLPQQGPIKDFIHLNILQVFLDKQFDDAIAHASQLYHARSYMDLNFYRSKHSSGAINNDVLDKIIAEHAYSMGIPIDIIRHALFNFIEIIDEKSFYFLTKKIDVHRITQIKDGISSHLAKAPKSKPTIRVFITQKIKRNIDHEVNAILFRLVGSFLDQGVSLWPFFKKTESFHSAVHRMAKKSFCPLAHFIDNKELVDCLSLPLEQTAKNLLGKILAQEELYFDYIKESLLNHRGWSGMINVIAHRPESLAKYRKINIAEMFTVKLALEWLFIKKATHNFEPITKEMLFNHSAPVDDTHLNSLTYWLMRAPWEIAPNLVQKCKDISVITLQKLLHQAFEESYYQNIAQQFISIESSAPKINKKFQAIFCMDDREASLVEHLESVCPEVETFGFPGFFGIDCYFKPHKNDLLEKMCPVPVTPKHVVMEKSAEDEELDHNILELASFISRHGANSILFGFISSYTLGHLSLFRLLLSFFHPFKLAKTKQLTIAADETTLIYERQPEKHLDLFIGYTHEEMADRINGVLRNIGLYQNFAPLVFVLGHGSSSVNNPHFAAYDCGACSGRPGEINARIFSAMANDIVVRALIKEKGITIPDTTVFIGGYHDTCSEDVRFFAVDKLSLETTEQAKPFFNYLHTARERNAHERCQQFALVSPHLSGEQALKEVQHRAKALFEPRPELGHTNSTLCIVGRRFRSLGKKFRRRTFLQSYDPTIDASGDILAALMSAVIPVCGGINLDYFFSRIDPAIYGCGTKLSHNVCSLIGVGNGLDDDLRTGLPIQMTELHDPIRLLIIIEQTPDIIAHAVLDNKALSPWVKNDWIKIASLHPEKDHLVFLRAKDNHFEEIPDIG